MLHSWAAAAPRCCRRTREPKTEETTLSSFENVAFGLIVLQVLGLS